MKENVKTDRVEEVKKVLRKSKEGVKVTFNEVCNFIEYPMSEEEVAQQICQLIEEDIKKAYAKGLEDGRNSLTNS